MTLERSYTFIQYKFLCENGHYLSHMAIVRIKQDKPTT